MQNINNKNELVISSIASKSRFEILDLIVLSLYCLLLIFIGYIFSRREKSINDYFKGGNRVPAWVAGLSLIATTFSAVSFMSLPGKSFSTNMLYVLLPLGSIVAIFFVIKWILPFFIRLNITSAYEYLEKRYSLRIRTVGSSIFILGELFRMGVILLLPAMVLSVVSGFNIYHSIIIMGIIATVYTLLGGIEAVVWTDVLQVIVLIAGMLLAIGIILFRLNFNISEISETAFKFQKMKIIDTDFNLSKTTIWIFILYAFGKLNVYLSNQAIVQRFISTANEKEAGKSMIFNAFLSIPIFLLFLFFGVLIFVYYHHFPEKFNPLLGTQDEIVPYFIVAELPAGISGIMIASLFAASMSSFDSAINSTTTVVTTDFYIRYKMNFFNLSSLKFAKTLTALLGIFGTIVSIYLAGHDVSSLFDMFIEIIGIFGGGLAGTFLLGIVTMKGNSNGALSGIIFSLAIVLLVKYFTSIHFFSYAFIGMGSSFIIGYLTSLIIGSKPTNLKGLTLYTLKNEG